MVAIKLREAMQAYKRRTGQRMTYQILAERTGVAKGTLEVIGKRLGYNATVNTLEKICLGLDVTFGDLVEIIPDPPKPKAKRTQKK
ncbi:MAG: helix-turn-helix transcriptional regulator [Phycisphaerae bacterium]|jgi:DNA-binding Xre family transcriptional regulator